MTLTDREKQKFLARGHKMWKRSVEGMLQVTRTMEGRPGGVRRWVWLLPLAVSRRGWSKGDGWRGGVRV